MLLIVVYCAARLAAAAWRRETELDTDAVHLLMGVAMAGTLAPALSFAPSAAWVTVFAVTAAWFAWQAVRVRRGLGAGRWRCPYPVPHLIESLAMVYMLAAVRGTGSRGTGMFMSGMVGAAGMARVPELAVVFALFMVGYVTWLGDRLTLAGSVTSSATGCWPIQAPRAAACYKIAMGITMGYMLIIML